VSKYAAYLSILCKHVLHAAQKSLSRAFTVLLTSVDKNLPTLWCSILTDNVVNTCINVECVQANVMLEYTLDDAEFLLTKNHNAALKSLEVVENDLGFLRDQTTTIEVSILYDITVHQGLPSNTGWAKKTGPVWVLITQPRLVVERRVICQKFQNAVKNKWQICMVKHLNIFCLICVNLHYPWN